MASPATIFFAGVATVVAAIGVGFGSALVLTAPAHKEPPSAFAKRDEPIQKQPQAVSVATNSTGATEAVESSARPTTPPPASTEAPKPPPPTQTTDYLIPAPGKSAEEVAALTFAPPQVLPPAEALPETKPAIANPLPQSDNAAKPDVSSSAPSKPNIAKEVKPKEKAVAKAKRNAQPRIERPNEAIQTQEREQADQARQVERKRQVKEPRERRRVLVAERRRHIVEREEADDVSERTLFIDREPRRGGLFGGIFGFGD